MPGIVRFLLLFGFAAVALAQQPPLPPLRSHGDLIYPPIARAARVSGRVTVEFAILPAGETAQVQAVDGPAMLRQAAANYIATWKFDPSTDRPSAQQKFRASIHFKIVDKDIDPRLDSGPKIESDGPGHFTITTFISDTTLTDCPTGADEVPPTTSDPGDFVEISRSACMGTCPDYTVRVRASGEVDWDGGRYVAVRGKRRARIDPEAARGLLEQFRTAQFWSWCGSYWRNVTDSAGTGVLVRLGGRTRKIDDYAESGPAPLQDLLDEVDRVADSHRWRHGDAAREPLERLSSDSWLPKPDCTPLMAAAGRSEIEAVKKLLEAKPDLARTDASGWNALMYAAHTSRDQIVQLLLEAGADPNQASPRGDTPLMAGAVFGIWNDRLVQAGARPNAQNRTGQTALMALAARAEAKEIERALKAGASATLKDAQGRTALDYLNLGRCGRNPFDDPVESRMRSDSRCTALDEDEVKATRALLLKAMGKQPQ